MTNKTRKGFTLIEIVIVLAIAALILVVVFFAVQGAQRGQRNTARQQLASRTLAGIAAFRGNNGGTATFGTTSPATDFNSTQFTTYVNNRAIGGQTYSTVTAVTTPSTTGCDANATSLNVGTQNGRDFVQICTETTNNAATGGVWYTAQQ